MTAHRDSIAAALAPAPVLPRRTNGSRRGVPLTPEQRIRRHTTNFYRRAREALWRRGIVDPAQLEPYRLSWVALRDIPDEYGSPLPPSLARFIWGILATGDMVAIARLFGVPLGPPSIPPLTEFEERLLRAAWGPRPVSLTELARMFSCSRRTIHQMLHAATLRLLARALYARARPSMLPPAVTRQLAALDQEIERALHEACVDNRTIPRRFQFVPRAAREVTRAIREQTAPRSTPR